MSRAAERLAAALRQRAARLALEIDDEDVVLGDQHLAEMKIAMVADFHRAGERARQPAQAVVEPAAGGGDQPVDQVAVGLVADGAQAGEMLADAGGLRADGGDPGLDVVGGDRLWAEVLKRVVARQRNVHLRDATADLRHVAQIGGLVLALGASVGVRQQPLLFGVAVEIAGGEGPGIAWFWTKA